MSKSLFRIGDTVKPKPEWIGDPNNVPSGKVIRIEPWGDIGAIYVEGERRAFSAHVFDRAAEESMSGESIAPCGRERDHRNSVAKKER